MLSTLLRQPRVIWYSLKLAQQFLIVSASTTLLAMLVVGAWLSNRIEHSVAQNAALETVLYVESYIGDRIQDLATNPSFQSEVQKGLEALVLQTPRGRRIISFKVWVSGGRIIYASNSEEAGKTYAPTEGLKRAWNGTVTVEVDELDEQESQYELAFKIPLIEIYVPVRQRFGGDIFAVVEFYEEATFLSKEIYNAKIEAWLLLSLIGLCVVAALFSMASRASRTIERQRSALSDRVDRLSRLLDQNRALRQKVEQASQRTAALNERYLRRIGSDLHDGPAQLITLALFQLDSIPMPDCDDDIAFGNKSKVRSALSEALVDIRNLATGLSVPELDSLSFKEAAVQAVEAHEHRTESRVATELGDLPSELSRDIKLTAYRFIQEGLNNSQRHAPGASTKLRARTGPEGTVVLEVEDDGPGFSVDLAQRDGRIGLSGLRERIECVGGQLEIDSSPGQGTRLVAHLPSQQVADYDL